MPNPLSSSYIDRCSGCDDEVWVSQTGLKAAGVRKEDLSAICVECFGEVKEKFEKEGKVIRISKLTPEQILEMRAFLSRQ